MVNKKKVLIVEDQELQRKALQDILEGRGFEVYSASNAAEARQLAELHWDELDVVILDMELDDPDEPQTTGAKIGIEFRENKKSFPPEFLIYSVKNQINYYRLALRLGAADYLLKDVDDLLVVLQHVRVLALRRALNGENPKIASEIAQIAVHSKSQPEAILTFCRRVLKPEFEACLDTPFVILFTEGDTTQNAADNTGLPPGDSAFYHTLQALAHGRGNLTEPFIFEASELGEPPDQKTARLYGKLDYAAFLPLSLSSNLSLSIGLLHQEESEQVRVPADEKALCKVLAQYLRLTVLQNIMTIWSQWTELRATRTSTAKLCLSVGQEIKDGLDTENMEQMEDLAEDLNNTGKLLIQIDSGNWRDGSDTISVKEVLVESWDRIAQSENHPETELDLQGDCTVQAQSIDLEIIASRLLQWFMYRSKSTPLDVKPIIKIECQETNGRATVTFEDNSNRLPKKLRDDMFAPFTQALPTPFADLESDKLIAEPPAKNHLNAGRYLPLYLAKMLVEGRYRGVLEDHSDEIKERSYGHRILMQFPTANKVD